MKKFLVNSDEKAKEKQVVYTDADKTKAKTIQQTLTDMQTVVDELKRDLKILQSDVRSIEGFLSEADSEEDEVDDDIDVSSTNRKRKKASSSRKSKNDSDNESDEDVTDSDEESQAPSKKKKVTLVRKRAKFVVPFKQDPEVVYEAKKTGNFTFMNPVRKNQSSQKDVRMISDDECDDTYEERQY